MDVLAFGTHPDDLEISCGGTLILLADRGYQVGAVDLTKGELGTRGTAEIRAIRRHRPRLVLAPYWEGRHYDHIHASHLVAEAAFYAGLSKLDTGQESFRPFRVLFYVSRVAFKPSFVVDVSETFDDKMQAVRSYRSQFYNDQPADGPDDPETEPETMISTPLALEVLETMARYYGAMIGARYGEPYLMRETLEIPDMVSFFRTFPDSRQAHLFPSP